MGPHMRRYSRGGSAHAASSFSITERVWLATSAAVDIVLCLVLCGELVYARRKLAQRGGSMREVVMRLIVSYTEAHSQHDLKGNHSCPDRSLISMLRRS